MSTLDNNIERLLILSSGIADNGDFNEKTLQLRINHDIPQNGFPITTDFEEYRLWKASGKHRELHQEVKKVVEKHPDLTPDMVGFIYNHMLFPGTIIGQTDGYRISTEVVNGREVCRFEFCNYIEPKMLEKAFKNIKQINDRMPHLRPLSNLKRDMEILKLSQQKGEQVESNLPEIEDDDIFTDEAIIAKIFPEEIDTPENLRKNRSLIRKRRSLAEKRIKELFPNICRPCESN